MPDPDILACPLDQSPLKRVGNAWVCAEHHSFDRARQGYVNLLPVQFKRSKDPGDSKAMVRARQSFLHKRHYQPISDACHALLRDTVLADAEDTLSVLDAGCGDGYYLQRLRHALPTATRSTLIGLDVSKWAVLAGAKRDTESLWVVGSNAHLPILPERLDAVLCLFGFPAYDEFARVLKHSGGLLMVDPGPDHLIEVRRALYTQLEPYRERAVPEPFVRHAQRRLTYSTTLEDAATLAELIQMTPHAFRAPPKALEALLAQDSLSVTVDVHLSLYLLRD
ncbi:MAG: putative RNA methyltransferase [Saccharospirillum sp.]